MLTEEQDNLFDEDDDKIIWVSKSKIKRDAEDLKKFGAKLIALSDKNLAKIPLDEKLSDAIQLARTAQRGALRRQLQFIGKLLRNRELEDIRDALDRIENKHNQQQTEFHRLEQLRDYLISQGDSAISELLTEYSHLDRQHLRILVRNAKREQAKEKGTLKYYREIFQYLKTEFSEK